MNQTLRILHCLRSPLGGLFRHVCDLAEMQVKLGHEVGIICDQNTGGETADIRLSELSRALPLGVKRVPMSRNIGLTDVKAFRVTKDLVRSGKIQILHGHGAKGGAYSRLVTRSLKKTGVNVLSFYTPHGGSLHYDRKSIKGRVYLDLERYLGTLTDGIIFESAYSAKTYSEKIGDLQRQFRIVPNGLHESEFTLHTPREDAADVIFIGELRHLKGVDLLLHALSEIRKKRPLKAHFYGDGPDTEIFKTLAYELSLNEYVDFPGRMPAQKAFDNGQLLVVPSRAESFPYIVLEAGAAAIPLIVTNVGGIPEIIGSQTDLMIPPDDAAALIQKIEEYLSNPSSARDRALSLQSQIRARFTVEKMANDINEFYFTRLAN